MEVALKDGSRKGSYPVEEQIPATLEEMVALWGEDKVFGMVARMAKSDLTNGIRSRQRNTDETDEQITIWVEKWVPGTKKQAKTVNEKLEAILAGLDDEARAAVLAQLG